MKPRTPAAALLVVLALLAVSGCDRELRQFSPEADNATARPSGQRLSSNQPAMLLGGQVKTAARNTSMYDDNAWSVSQGKRLFRWYNCAGCHANGGGGIGPALMDEEWLYGSDPASIFNSVVQGRPNGMPSFGGHIPEDQVWQLVAYVRSMSGHVRQDVAPSRSDSLYPGEPENARAPINPPGRAP